jgi:hypothetical protein
MTLLPEEAGLGRRLEANVPDACGHGLGRASAGVVEEGEQRVVSQAEPLRGRRDGEERFHLVTIEIGHRAGHRFLDGDIQDAMTQLGVPRIAVSDVREEAVDGDQPAVAGGHAVLPLSLEMGKEGQHGVGTEIRQPEADDLAARPACREPEQELEAIAIRVDGVGADIALRRKVLLEEAAEQGGQSRPVGHD